MNELKKPGHYNHINGCENRFYQGIPCRIDTLPPKKDGNQFLIHGQVINGHNSTQSLDSGKSDLNSTSQVKSVKYESEARYSNSKDVWKSSLGDLEKIIEDVISKAVSGTNHAELFNISSPLSDKDLEAAEKMVELTPITTIKPEKIPAAQTNTQPSIVNSNHVFVQPRIYMYHNQNSGYYIMRPNGSSIVSPAPSLNSQTWNIQTSQNINVIPPPAVSFGKVCPNVEQLNYAKTEPAYATGLAVDAAAGNVNVPKKRTFSQINAPSSLLSPPKRAKTTEEIIIDPFSEVKRRYMALTTPSCDTKLPQIHFTEKNVPHWLRSKDGPSSDYGSEFLQDLDALIGFSEHYTSGSEALHHRKLPSVSSNDEDIAILSSLNCVSEITTKKSTSKYNPYRIVCESPKPSKVSHLISQVVEPSYAASLDFVEVPTLPTYFDTIAEEKPNSPQILPEHIPNALIMREIKSHWHGNDSDDPYLKPAGRYGHGDKYGDAYDEFLFSPRAPASVEVVVNPNSTYQTVSKRDSFCGNCFATLNKHCTRQVISQGSKLSTENGCQVMPTQCDFPQNFCNAGCVQVFLRKLETTHLLIKRIEEDSYASLATGSATTGFYKSAVGLNSAGIVNSSESSTYNTVIDCKFIDSPTGQFSLVSMGPAPRSHRNLKRLAYSALSRRRQTIRLYRGIKWKYFSHPPQSNPIATVPTSKAVLNVTNRLTDTHALQLLKESKIAVQLLPESPERDNRVCSLCFIKGDAEENGPGRLLCYGVDKWLHINCVLWCMNVYETQGGALCSVQSNLNLAARRQCTGCGLYGAGLPCYSSRCQVYYHVPCAQKSGCMFFADRSMFCPLHQPGCQLSMAGTDSPSQILVSTVLTSLTVDRRVYIERPEKDQVARVVCSVGGEHAEPAESKTSCAAAPLLQNHSKCIRVGSVILCRIGQLLPSQISSGHYNTQHSIYPIGYHSARFYWSSVESGKRCIYHCHILERNDYPLFRVNAHEVDGRIYKFESQSCATVWQEIFQKIVSIRLRDKMIKLHPHTLTGDKMYGFGEYHIKRIVESLPGVESLRDYHFRFGRLELISEMPVPVNPTGCARSEEKREKFVPRPKYVHLRHHVAPSRRFVTSALPGSSSVTKGPRHSDDLAGDAANGSDALDSLTGISHSARLLLANYQQQYREMLKSSKHCSVVLKRSHIQGMGLYAAQEIEPNKMVIEYIGELIRPEVANRREKVYDAQNKGTYMFRLDDDTIVDASSSGGLARYINHSCEPNCATELVQVGAETHVVIVSSHHIDRGEELTYDYKFDYAANDSATTRIPCLCGAPACRKWMN